MEVRLILLAILAHIVGDFIFQGDLIAKMRFPQILTNESTNLGAIKLLRAKKNIIFATRRLEKKTNLFKQQKKWYLNIFDSNLKIAFKEAFSLPLKYSTIIYHTFKGNLVHSLIQGFTFINLIFINNAISNLVVPNKFFLEIRINLNWDNGLYVIGGFTLMHLLVDQMKVILSYRYPRLSKKIYFFMGDQVIHLLSFLLLPSLFFKNLSIDGEPLKKMISNPIDFILKERLLIILILFFIVTAFAGIFIKIVIDHVDAQQTTACLGSVKEKKEVFETDNAEIRHGGYIIGILERILILSAILIEHPELIGYILAAKSIARLKKLKEDKFAEYFLIGNSLSFVFAIIGGIIIRFLIKH